MADGVLTKRRHRQRFRNLGIEPLESRDLLSVAPAVMGLSPALAVHADGEGGSAAGSADVRASLAIVATPSETDYADHVPDSIEGIGLDTSFFVEIWVQDSSGTPSGIVGGHVDIRYTTEFIDSTGVMDHAVFDLLVSGTTDDAAGHVDDFGGATLSAGQGVAPEWARFGYLEFVAVEPGVVSFDLEPGEFEFSLLGIGNVPWADASLSGAEARVGLTAVDDSFAVADSGSSVALDVLANDIVLGEGPQSVTISAVIPDDSDADIQVSANGTKLMYRPASGYVGADRFRYEIRDAAGFTDTALVEVNVVKPPLWQNTDAPNDVNMDGLVTPLDVLEIINAINSKSVPQALPNPATQVQPPPFVDVNGDGLLTPLDVLIVVNQLNSDYGAEGEYALPMQVFGERPVPVPSNQAAPVNESRVFWGQYGFGDEWLQPAAIGAEEEINLAKSRTERVGSDDARSIEFAFGEDGASCFETLLWPM